MPSLGGWEWVILLIVALLLFGGTRLAGIGKSAGKAIREFKEETAAIAKDEEPPVPASDPPKPVRADSADADTAEDELR